jgi:CheY-like chemotaxis protein
MARILVIDDDRSLLQMMQIMLQKAGHDPILVDNGEKGIEAAIKEQPDMAIVDIMMPDVSGYDVCRRLRADPRTMTIPLLILTARSQPMDREMAAEAGADDFVTKPVTLNDLIDHVNDLLRVGATNVPSQQPAAPSPEPAQAAAPKPATGPLAAVFEQLPLVAVTGLRGGVGTTTVAVNLGLGLMQHGRVAIVDLNTDVGQVAIQLRLMPPPTTWLTLVGAGDHPEKRLIGSSLMMHHSGVAMMAAPVQPTQDRLSPEALYYVYSVLTEGFQRIAIDVPAIPGSMGEATFTHARHIVVVAGDDPASLAVAPESLKAMREKGYSAKLHVVLNRSRPHGLPTKDIITTLGQTLVAEIPYEPAQVEALASGAPLVMSQPGSAFSRIILNLARIL